MTDDAHTLWFQDPEAWVAHCTEAYHLACNVALPVIAATAEGEAGDRVSCVVNTDGHPRDVERRLREVARRLRDLAAFLEDAAETGFAEGDFKLAIRGSDAVQ